MVVCIDRKKIGSENEGILFKILEYIFGIFLKFISFLFSLVIPKYTPFCSSFHKNQLYESSFVCYFFSTYQYILPGHVHRGIIYTYMHGAVDGNC